MSIETELTIIEVSTIFIGLALLFHIAAWRLHEKNRAEEGVPVWLKYDEQELVRRVSNELARQWGIQSSTFSWHYITDENDKETESEAKE